MIEKVALEFDEELQIEEDAALAARLGTLVKIEGKKKKKKKSGHHCPKRKRNASPRMQGWKRRTHPEKKKKRKRKEGGSNQPLTPLPKKRKGKEKVVKAPPQVAEGQQNSRQDSCQGQRQSKGDRGVIEEG